MVVTRSMSKKTTAATRSMSRTTTTKKTTDAKIAVGQTSTKQAKKKETRTTIKAKSGTTKLIVDTDGGFPDGECHMTDWTIMDDAFDRFMKDFLKDYWPKNPHRRIASWGQIVAGNAKWDSMSDDDKAHYVKLFKEEQAEIRRKMENEELSIMSRTTTTNKTTDAKIAVGQTSTKQATLKEMRTKIKGKSVTIQMRVDDNGVEIPGSRSRCYLTDSTIMDDALNLFMKDFMKEYWANNPHKRVASWDQIKAGNIKWNSMSDDDKAHYVKLVKEES